eukprot:scaffold7340_cov266-Pinguiococcus_pyrenoidosus.AAC.20
MSDWDTGVQTGWSAETSTFLSTLHVGHDRFAAARLALCCKVRRKPCTSTSSRAASLRLCSWALRRSSAILFFDFRFSSSCRLASAASRPSAMSNPSRKVCSSRSSTLA